MNYAFLATLLVCRTLANTLTVQITARCPKGPNAYICPFESMSGTSIMSTSCPSTAGFEHYTMSFAMGVRIENSASTWASMYTSANNADIYVSESLMSNASYSSHTYMGYLAMPWVNMCDGMPQGVQTTIIDPPFAQNTYPASGIGCYPFRQNTAYIYVDEYLSILVNEEQTTRSYTFLACAYNVTTEISVSFRAFLLPKTTGSSYIIPPIPRREYQQGRRCHWFTVTAPNSGYSSIQMTTPYEVVESIDSTEYAQSNVRQEIVPRFCTLTGTTYAFDVPASSDSLLEARIAYMRIPPTFEMWSIDDSNPSISFIYVLDGDMDIVDGISQDLETYESNGHGGPSIPGYGMLGPQLIVIGVPFYPNRISELAPLPSSGSPSSVNFSLYSEDVSVYDSDGDLEPMSASQRRSWPNDALDVFAYASGAAGISVARYLVNVVESSASDFIANNYGTYNSNRRFAVSSRTVIGSDVAATCAINIVRRRMACGSFDAGIAFDPPRYYGARDSCPYIAFVGRDSLEWQDIAADVTASVYFTGTNYAFRQEYSYMSMRENAPNVTGISYTSLESQCPALDILHIYTTGVDPLNNVEAAYLETTGNSYGDWAEEITRASLDVYKLIRTATLLI